MKRVTAVCLLALALAACKKEATPPPATTAPAVTPGTALPAPVATDAGPVELKEVVETTPNYVVGITYNTKAAQYPGLARELKRYADNARSELIEAANGRTAKENPSPYELSLTFDDVVDAPDMAAVSADGSSYTGGAHAAPLIARFVWLPKQNKLLKAEELIPDKTGWDAVSRYVREQLHSALSQRIDADDLAPAVRAEQIETGGRMIDDGTAADPANFAMFEPMRSADGKLSGLKFVFAPYEVGPYSDGTQMVEVPAAVLLPHLAPAYRPLFVGGA
ncbi:MULTISPECIES: DUF3298 and DUF4163 domain-containing protein [unclassified Lysobacter]|uniref:DUF3298 and DUF4163 domain-containing protein n=1 Tax=unclassified Lysobacter TaxID=2635362 RepID=UPI001BEA4E81|nr:MULTISPECIES: DUF3298 and DUF4163 domain-containing protein [unclassified Lysobacter]MBT2748902.1 hypothetical protein [Lysobacter sp. ISL-42]MBT2753070.1 hypothetical protein [Lysobacter sp. ISL-50]MBT2777239.1 hypothetical protein [Lysobacter sp. ISL-54]MBT2783219.1 hypothetical protein [Lysobacter sp. ISL-52]